MSIERIGGTRAGSVGQHLPFCQALPARACVQLVLMVDTKVETEVIALPPAR